MLGGSGLHAGWCARRHRPTSYLLATSMGHLGQQIKAAADLLRPRTLFRKLSRVDTLADTTRELTTAVERLRIQTEQLLTIQRLDWDQRHDLARLDRLLDKDATLRHVCA